MQDGLLLSPSQNIGTTLSQYISQANHIVRPPVSTGSTSLDNLLSGGIKPDSIYEINGLLNSGKLTLVLNVVCNFLKQGKKVFWVDTSSKIQLNDLIRLNGFKSSLLTSDNLQYSRIDHLIQLVVLMKKLKEFSSQDAYSLVVINEFSDLVHSSFLVLEGELNKRKLKIEELKGRLSTEKKEREKFGETFQSIGSIPLQGPSIIVRQNKFMHQILGSMASYNQQFQSTFILSGSLNTASQKILLEVYPKSDKESVRQMKTVYQSKLAPILGEEAPWLGLLESRIVLYKDWRDKIDIRDMNSVKNATTLTYASLRFNRPVISKDLNCPTKRVIKTTKKVRFKITSEGVEDVDNVIYDSVVGFSGTQLNDSVDFDDMSILMNPTPTVSDRSFEPPTGSTRNTVPLVRSSIDSNDDKDDDKDDDKRLTPKKRLKTR